MTCLAQTCFIKFSYYVLTCSYGLSHMTGYYSKVFAWFPYKSYILSGILRSTRWSSSVLSHSDPASQKLAAIHSTLNFACPLKHALISIDFLTNCTTKSSKCGNVAGFIHDNVNDCNRPDAACKDSRPLTYSRRSLPRTYCTW